MPTTSLEPHGRVDAAVLGGRRPKRLSNEPSGPFSPSFSATATRERFSVNDSHRDTAKIRADGKPVAWAGTTPVVGGLRRPPPTRLRLRGSFPPRPDRVS